MPRMGYTAIEEPQGNSFVGALAGAAIGAVVGAVVLGAVVAVSPTATNLYTTTAVQPAVVGSAAAIPMSRAQHHATAAHVQYASAEDGSVEQSAPMPASVQAPQVHVYSWAFALFATVAGAVNGLFLWNNKKVAMAATTGRREALMTGVAATGVAAAGPAFAAYGDTANVFGKKAPTDQARQISGEGWTGTLPAKYNVSNQSQEFPGTVARWEDNFDQVNHCTVTINNVGKNSIKDLGTLDACFESVVRPMLGLQSWEGGTISEGGFGSGKVSSAALLDASEFEQNGKTYYMYEVLSRTADGNEGGRHQLFKMACSNGKLYVFKHQAGDKRWFLQDLEKPIRASLNNFIVA